MIERTVRPEHAEKIRESLGPMVRYLNRLFDRMSKLGLSGDELYKDVNTALRAVCGLHMSMHYRSCREGCGRRAWVEPVEPEPNDDDVMGLA